MRESVTAPVASQVLALSLAAFLPPVTAGESSPEFTFSLSPCPGVVEALPGEPWELDVGVILTTTQNPDPELGAAAWSISMTAEGANITEITTQGTAAASVADDPPGFRLAVGFERSSVGFPGTEACDGRNGAVSAVVLSYSTIITLPPEGEASIALIKVAGSAPGESGAQDHGRILFVDSCRGAGWPVENTVSWHGEPWTPALVGCDFEIVAVEAQFLRGDANADGMVNMSDALAILNCKFLGNACPSCFDASDVNDDGTDNIADPIRLLSHLFIGDEPLPTPGPIDCGVDSSPDALVSCTYDACAG